MEERQPAYRSLPTDSAGVREALLVPLREEWVGRGCGGRAGVWGVGDLGTR